jgi:glyoxylase-like metal-dependent hydrolase (beta-lactamase superfamily II)
VGAGDEAAAMAAALGGEPIAPEALGPESSGSLELPAEVGPFAVVPTPGHARDHVAFVRDGVCFCGDLVLGEGSTIVPPAAGGGSLADYMDSLRRLAELELELLAPGHGPWITEPAARIAEYIEHRAEREQHLVAALDTGERSRERLLAAAWDDVPELLRPAAALAMQAHIEKLQTEQRWRSLGEELD